MGLLLVTAVPKAYLRSNILSAIGRNLQQLLSQMIKTSAFLMWMVTIDWIRAMPITIKYKPRYLSVTLSVATSVCASSLGMRNPIYTL